VWGEYRNKYKPLGFESFMADAADVNAGMGYSHRRFPHDYGVVRMPSPDQLPVQKFYLRMSRRKGVRHDVRGLAVSSFRKSLDSSDALH
jgi:hypothetical protein